MKITPNVSYNCNCHKLKEINSEEIKNNIHINQPNKKNTQIITFYKRKNNKKTLF